MIAIVLCIASFLGCFFAARRSLVYGLVSVLGVGYIYGIVRANVYETFSHFIFDAALLGLYLAQGLWLLRPTRVVGLETLKRWVGLLIAWPVALLIVPIQDPLIQLVGLRGNALFLPFLLIGAQLQRRDIGRLTLWIAGLNMMAFAVACAEFFFGVERFVPFNAATEIIYKSTDVAGYTAFRIPSTFPSASAYGGTMVMTLPFLIGALGIKHRSFWHGHLLVLALAATLLGVFMSAGRTPVVILSVLLLVTMLHGRFKWRTWLSLAVMISGLGWVVSSDERLQRFTTLADTDFVEDRIAGSVNGTFLEVVSDYPLGNGLGGGGTSIPYFMQDLVKDPTRLENEYARIVMEQGIPGLALWLAFLTWLFSRNTTAAGDAWHLGRRLAWFACGSAFANGVLGVGLLTSIPASCFLLMSAGWIAVHQPSDDESACATKRRIGRRQPSSRDCLVTALPKAPRSTRSL